MHVHIPPIAPGEIYSQGFWHAVLAAILYFIGAAILMINLTGFLRGHFPQQFDLDNDQRTLILQTMGFFFWLAGGAGIFCAIEDFTFANALYYTDVVCSSILLSMRGQERESRRNAKRVPSPSSQLALATSIRQQMPVGGSSSSLSCWASSN